MPRTKRKPGRPPQMFTCRLCRRKLNQTQMRMHEPGCRRKHLLAVGRHYTTKRGLRIAPVELLKIGRGPAPKLTVKDLHTGRTLVLKSPRALREWMEQANIRFFRGEPEA